MENVHIAFRMITKGIFSMELFNVFDLMRAVSQIKITVLHR